MPALTAVSVLLFVLVHLFVGALRFLDGVPRSRWLSLAGGVAVAYVFMHILPELNAHQQHVETRTEAGGPGLLESEIYLVAMAGLAVFYGLERYVRARRSEMGGDDLESGPFWLHAGSFALYNLLIGYLLLHREETGVLSLVTYTVAMALHFVTNDYGLRQDYQSVYDRKARWVLAGAVVAGWLLGFAVELSELAVGLLFAFLSGGIVLNVLKEELPEDRKSRFLPFAGGLAGYAALLLLAA
ncbi:hypothetical protein [Azospirillum sp. SYSU D00513]|uniref:hypothetical protein n=1 Tax=Azospirillum sp. SYSU D00513 TaxID=2812561 RepID=UPI001A95A8CA|nr:hypothetical protein [Azospirillum sp. SYSU D00513]